MPVNSNVVGLIEITQRTSGADQYIQRPALRHDLELLGRDSRGGKPVAAEVRAVEGHNRLRRFATWSDCQVVYADLGGLAIDLQGELQDLLRRLRERTPKRPSAR